MYKKLKDFLMNNPRLDRYGESLVLSIVSSLITGAILLQFSDSDQTTKDALMYVIFIISAVILILFLIVQLIKHLKKDKQ